ncbi:acyltransferase [Fusobacterium sp. oral taxon 370]|uniref:acyltransferase n=1 Tax=Fusobacterium sp. oral taxon 370 TaxID=712288 RepID=UPI00030E159D|nr:acyltransferase [Fusobacterium sp. oral taxon 370]
MFKKKFLEKIDNFIYNFLEKNVKIMPKRFSKLITYFYTDSRIRRIYWKERGVILGENTYLNLGVIIVESQDENVKLTIGKNVSVAPYVTFILDSSPNSSKILLNNIYVNERLHKMNSITIEDDVWIGANVTILPGVYIKQGAIIGAGSVVLNDVDEFTIVAGVPAKVIRKFN